MGVERDGDSLSGVAANQINGQKMAETDSGACVAAIAVATVTVEAAIHSFGQTVVAAYRLKDQANYHQTDFVIDWGQEDETEANFHQTGTREASHPSELVEIY